jgi:hypothetical protein
MKYLENAGVGADRQVGLTGAHVGGDKSPKVLPPASRLKQVCADSGTPLGESQATGFPAHPGGVPDV